MIYFKQVNLNRSTTAMFHLTDKMRDMSSYILLLTEPNVRKGKVTSLTKGMRAFPSCGVEKQRAAIVTNRNLIAVELTQFGNKDLVPINLKMGKQEIIIASVYCDINKNLLEHQMVRVIDYAEKNGLPLILGGT